MRQCCGIFFLRNWDFNSRTSCEVRQNGRYTENQGKAFQLTHLLRGATAEAAVSTGNIFDFNSRTSCEVRLPPTKCIHIFVIISTHAPLARCDDRMDKIPRRIGRFQLTHLLRGATRAGAARLPPDHISTHAPLARCDTVLCEQIEHDGFQLTHLLRGATRALLEAGFTCQISTHAPLARCDACAATASRKVVSISTHAPLARCDAYCFYRCKLRFHFNSRTSCEVRHIQSR